MEDMYVQLVLIKVLIREKNVDAQIWTNMFLEPLLSFLNAKIFSLKS